VPERNPITGVAIAIQTLFDFLGSNPYRHILATDLWGERILGCSSPERGKTEGDFPALDLLEDSG